MQTLSASATLVICYFSFSVSGKLCPTKTYSLLDTVSNDHIICPQPGEPAHWTECCGTVSSRRCCPGNNRLHDENGKVKRDYDNYYEDYDLDDLDEIFDSDVAENIGQFVAIIITVVVIIFVVTLLCCCCVPCCLCAKRRNLNRGGVVHSRPGTVPQQTAVTSPSQYPTQQHGPSQYPMQQQVPTPAQPQPYSDLPPPYPGPPVQGYPPQMPAGPGYSAQMPAGPGYPPQMSGGHPPAPGYSEYTEKQPAFNPNMQ